MSATLAIRLASQGSVVCPRDPKDNIEELRVTQVSRLSSRDSYALVGQETSPPVYTLVFSEENPLVFSSCRHGGHRIKKVISCFYPHLFRE